MSQDSLIKLNISQNYPDFELRPLDKQASLFKKGYLKKTLNPIQENIEDLCIYIIKYMIRGYS
jgi:hypothetical protein